MEKYYKEKDEILRTLEKSSYRLPNLAELVGLDISLVNILCDEMKNDGYIDIPERFGGKYPVVSIRDEAQYFKGYRRQYNIRRRKEFWRTVKKPTLYSIGAIFTAVISYYVTDLLGKYL